MCALRIFIVDDNDLVRKSIVRLLSDDPSCVVCGEARTSDEALRIAFPAAPDVVLLDINLPDATAFETANLIRRKLPQAALVVISADSAAVISLSAQRAGADAWLEKSRIGSDLLPIIKKLDRTSDGVS